MWSRRRDGSYTPGQRLALLRQQIEAAEAELVDREAELVEVRVDLSAFRLKYDLQVGRKIENLESIEGAIDRCTKRIKEFRQWGSSGPPKNRDGTEYVSVEEQYRRTWRDPSPPGPRFSPPPMSPAAKMELKALYRNLCRRFHPDLTQDPEERAWRTEVMAAVNAAYEMQSLVELQALAARPDRPSSIAGKTDQYRLDALLEKLQHIEQRIQAVTQEIYDLTHSPTMEMSLEVKLATRQGRDLLAEMATDVENDLERKRVELEFLQAQLRRLGIVCE